MLAFRSEAHVERWCKGQGVERGAVFSLEQAWDLGREWYRDKLSPDWQRASPADAEATFARLGLIGAFWRLRR